MNARLQLERLFHGGGAAPAPVEAPPQPAAPPVERPGKPNIRPRPSTAPDPWEPPDIRPGYEPRPKSRYHQHVNAEAKELLRLNGLGEFVR